MELTHKIYGSMGVVLMEGRLTKHENPIAEEFIMRFLDENALVRHLTIDLTSVAHMDSSGVGLLVQLYKVISERDGKVALVGMRKSLEETLKMTRLDDIFSIYANLDQAKAGLAD